MLKNSDYQLLDSGDGWKYEAFGPIKVIRPAAQAIWKKKKPEIWQEAEATFERNDSGNGEWTFHKDVPEYWDIQILNVHFRIKCTSFGHMGVFPEAYNNWVWLEKFLKKKQGLKVISLFSYTGAYSLICAKHGAEVCHVDASKSVVAWGRENALISGLDKMPIRWIIDDVRKFIQRETRRGKKYDGLIMDPPTYGRGSKGELWKIEVHLSELFEECKNILCDSPKFFMVNTYAGDITSSVIRNLMIDFLPAKGNIINNEMLIPEKNSDRFLPNGMTAVWSENELD